MGLKEKRTILSPIPFSPLPFLFFPPVFIVFGPSGKWPAQEPVCIFCVLVLSAYMLRIRISFLLLLPILYFLFQVLHYIPCICIESQLLFVRTWSRAYFTEYYI
jgi:hypothetical protein